MKTEKEKKEARRQWQKEYDRKRYLLKKEELLAKNKEYRIKNKDKIKVRVKEYYEENKEAIEVNQKKWRDNNKDKLFEYKKKWRDNNKDKIKAAGKSDNNKFTTYKRSAEKRGYVFRLSKKEFIGLIHSKCYLCGTEKAEGVDRINNEVGYTTDNSRPCCVFCNKMKWVHSKKEFLEQVAKIHNNNRMV